MKRFLWLGLLFLSASWLFFIPQFTLPDPTIGGLLLFLGILFMVAGVSRTKLQQVEKKYSLLLVPLLIALLIVPYPYNISLIILACGLLILLLLRRFDTTQLIGMGMSLSGVILLLQTTLLPLYTMFISHSHRIDALSPVVSWVSSLLGLHASTNHGLVFIQTIQHTYAITTTWENLGFYLWLNIFIGALFFFIIMHRKRTILRNTGVVLLASVPYLILRYIAVLYGYLSTSELSIFWDPLLMTISFLPFALLLMKLLPFNDVDTTTTTLPSLTFTKKHSAAFLMVFLLVFSVVGTCSFHDPGTEKNGRVLIDEYHSQWEDTTRPVDTEWYGLLSTYNYYSWAQFLGIYYDVDINNDSMLTSGLLSTYDILILKCPTESYTTEEVSSIKAFVNAGGGLYLIGDHTNVFGMNTFLNQVSEPFGIRFNTDATYEMGTGDLSIYQPDDLGKHPVLAHVKKFEFMTSCTLAPTSLAASVTMEPLIIGNRVISEPGTYATENFFRDSIASSDSVYGYLLQAAAMKHGNGRVVAFTDSTVFSSFSMFTDGYPAFTLGALEYLNRINTYAFVNIFFVVLAVLSALSLFYLLNNTKRIKILWIVLCAGLLAFCAATPLFSYLTMVSYPLPDAQGEFTEVCFEQQHSSFNVSVKPTVVSGDSSNNYATFYVWTQRVRCFPSLTATFEDAIQNSDIVVIINPIEPFTDQEVASLTSYLESGGRVLLMDSITNSGSTANSLVNAYGIWITTETTDHALYQNGSDLQGNLSLGNITTPYLSLSGGTQILLNDQNETTACMVEFRNTTTGAVGKLVLLVDSYSFSDAAMGGLFTEPSERERRLYSTEFFLFEKILTT